MVVKVASGTSRTYVDDLKGHLCSVAIVYIAVLQSITCTTVYFSLYTTFVVGEKPGLLISMVHFILYGGYSLPSVMSNFVIRQFSRPVPVSYRTFSIAKLKFAALSVSSTKLDSNTALHSLIWQLVFSYIVSK